MNVFGDKSRFSTVWKWNAPPNNTIICICTNDVTLCDSVTQVDVGVTVTLLAGHYEKIEFVCPLNDCAEKIGMFELGVERERER